MSSHAAGAVSGSEMAGLFASSNGRRVIAERFRRTCAHDHLRYHLHSGIVVAIGSHTRWLRSMGRA